MATAPAGRSFAAPAVPATALAGVAATCADFALAATPAEDGTASATG